MNARMMNLQLLSENIDTKLDSKKQLEFASSSNFVIFRIIFKKEAKLIILERIKGSNFNFIIF